MQFFILELHVVEKLTDSDLKKNNNNTNKFFILFDYMEKMFTFMEVLIFQLSEIHINNLEKIKIST